MTDVSLVPEADVGVGVSAVPKPSLSAAELVEYVKSRLVVVDPFAFTVAATVALVDVTLVALSALSVGASRNVIVTLPFKPS